MSLLERFKDEIEAGVGGFLQHMRGGEMIEGAEVREPGEMGGPETTTTIDPVIKINTAPAPEAGQLPGVINMEKETRDELQAVQEGERKEKGTVERLLENQQTSLANQEKAEIVAAAGIALALVIFFLRK